MGDNKEERTLHLSYFHVHSSSSLATSTMKTHEKKRSSGKMSSRKSVARLLSEELTSESSMANRVCCSASPPLSSVTSRPISGGLLADDCTVDTLSSQGARAVKGSPRASLRQARRKDSFRTLKARERHSVTSSHQLRTFYPAQDVAAPASPGKAEAATDFANGVTSRPERHRSHSDPVALLSQSTFNDKDCDVVVATQAAHARPQKPDSMPQNGTVFSAIDSGKSDEMFRQPETNPITEEQLINEVRGIYAGLVMVEKKCIEIDKERSESGSLSKRELSHQDWQTMIVLHRTLLNEHHDFFLASQHPSASPVLKRLAEKYAMPARMWRYGIHSFLELLRQKLPASLEYMLSFIYLSYSMMTLLLESVPAFKETWIECLGDLARYRMAVEEDDMRDREIWAGVSRYWYNRDADRSPDVGRIQHHLAVLSRPDLLNQLFYYTKALVSVQPFPNARESTFLLFNSLLNEQPPHQQPMITAFVTTHGVLFTRGPTEQFVARANEFLSLLHKDIGRLSRQGQQGAFITSCNLAAVCEYGEADSVIVSVFMQKQHSNVMEAYGSAMEDWISDEPSIDNLKGATDAAHITSQISSQLAFLGTSLASQTLSVILDQLGDPNMYPSVHISLAFIWCLSLHTSAMRQLETLIPWTKIATFLNTLFGADINISTIESESFPLLHDTQQLLEDFLIRGQVWSQLYYPEKFFEGAPKEDERPWIEEPSWAILRKHRCLWLGVRIATFRRWLIYSNAPSRFAPTHLAHSIAPIAETCGQLDGKASNETAEVVNRQF